MAIRKGLRFEVFKRDRFTCIYCGRKPPEVILHCDHLVPSSDGGPDTIENLGTSCEDCNLGKSNRRLEDVPPALADRAEEIAERRLQVEAYNAFLREQREQRERDIEQLGLYWFNQFKRKKNAYVFTPERERSIVKFLEHFPTEQILNFIDIAFRRVQVVRDNDDRAWRYFCGICWKEIKSTE